VQRRQHRANHRRPREPKPLNPERKRQEIMSTITSSRALGVDVGTMFFQTAEMKGEDLSLNLVRNAFIELSKTDDMTETIKMEKFQYVEDANNIYVIGEDAIRFAKMMPGKLDLRRPLQNGVLNADEEMKMLVLNEIIRSMVGKAPDRKSVVATCVSSPPVDGSPNNVFHEKRLRGMFENQGWNVIIMPEGQAVILSENPTTEDKDGNKLNFTGIGISFGAGRVNMVSTMKGVVGVGISTSRSGDWLDREVAGQLNVPVTQITSYKESKLDFSKIDDNSDKDFALDAYTTELFRYNFGKFAEQFNASKDKDQYDFPLDVVIAGGTSMPKGFIDKAKRDILAIASDLPFAVRDVRHAKDPRNAVCRGLMLRAINVQKQLEKKDSAEEILKS
jgi:hypothetical protein